MPKPPTRLSFLSTILKRWHRLWARWKQEEKKKAIYRDSYYGPKFGADLVIYLDAVNIQDSKAGLGTWYSVPAAVQNRRTVLAGTEYFSLNEVEVFYLDPSR